MIQIGCSHSGAPTKGGVGGQITWPGGQGAGRKKKTKQQHEDDNLTGKKNGTGERGKKRTKAGDTGKKIRETEGKEQR